MAAFSLTVSMHMSEEDFTMSFETLKTMFLDHHMLLLWTIPFALAVLLRIITHKFHHQLVFPLCKCSCSADNSFLTNLQLDFLVIPIIFYIVVASARLDLNKLRTENWLFDVGSASETPWYHYFSYLGRYLF